MNRIEFLKNIGALLVVPSIVGASIKTNETKKELTSKESNSLYDKDIQAKRKYPLTYNDCYRDIVFMGDIYLLNNKEYIVQSVQNGVARLISIKEKIKPAVIHIDLSQFKKPNKDFYFTGGNVKMNL